MKSLFPCLSFFLLLSTCLTACTAPITANSTSSSTSSSTTTTQKVQEEPVPGVIKKFVLLLGQSNMAGRGDLSSVQPIEDERIYMMRDFEWVPMQEPIFNDKQTAGAGPAASFAKAFVETYNQNLGLIPAAVGGTSLSDWSVGGDLYNNAVAMAEKAMESGEIIAILWHQGEADTGNNQYSSQLADIIDSMYLDLQISKDKVPFITGELFEQGPAEESKDFMCWPDKVNSHLDQLADYYPLYAVVSGKGLRHGGDRLHLDAPSARVLGYRFFKAYYELTEETPCPYSYSENLDDYLI